MSKHRMLLPVLMVALAPTVGCDTPSAKPKDEPSAADPSAAAPSAASLPEVRYYILSGG